MPASQLKRLKASLREQGITGPQKSKKQKKAQHSKSGNERVQKDAALHQIRESFNPFEYKAAARPEKFASVNSRSVGANGGSGRYKEVLHRPGVTKSAGEELRRKTLLPELQRRNKVGGLVDRRIGEGDVNMTPEERALQRFTQEKERKRKRAGMFDLEASDDDESGIGGKLTHGGRSLDDLGTDDFQDNVSGSSGAEESENDGLLQRKRQRSVEEGDESSANNGGLERDQPERKKTKKEVMEEVIAKSKLHKYERQQAKEDDDDLREELDKGFGEVLALLKGHQRPKAPVPAQDPPTAESSGPTMNPERQKLLDSANRDMADREYDARLRQLAQDTRAKPSERTKSAEEKAAAEAERLRELEEKRLKRMRGEDVSEDEQDHANAVKDANKANGDDEVVDEAAEFGLGHSSAQPRPKKQLVLDDEDEFDLDEDLVASASDVDFSDDDSHGSDDEEGGSESGEALNRGDSDDEFVKDFLGDVDGFAGKDAISAAVKAASSNKALDTSSGLAYTFPCPRSHAELLGVIKNVPPDQLNVVIQRVRALYHPSLSESNKESMADFACALVDHLSFMGCKKQPLPAIEQVVRHLHSLSRTYPTQIGEAFRRNLASCYEREQPHAGDLVILTAIGSIYPTSDSWHQVATPALTIMARWLGLHAPNPTKPANAQHLQLGAFLVAQCVTYQQLSKRYVPEAVRYTLRALSTQNTDPANVTAHVTNLEALAEQARDAAAFAPAFARAVPVLKWLGAAGPAARIRILLAAARTRRRPLELHHHRRQPIRSALPKFEDGFHPDRHYDPDAERSAARKLQREYARERKGAVRELRKDAHFLAREQLRDKKARDAEYERKYRRLVAEVQADEGHAQNAYEREKKARARKRK